MLRLKTELLIAACRYITCSIVKMSEISAPDLWQNRKIRSKVRRSQERLALLNAGRSFVVSEGSMPAKIDLISIFVSSPAGRFKDLGIAVLSILGFLAVLLVLHFFGLGFKKIFNAAFHSTSGYGDKRLTFFGIIMIGVVVTSGLAGFIFSIYWIWTITVAVGAGLALAHGGALDEDVTN
jgi:hypothetical protein